MTTDQKQPLEVETIIEMAFEYFDKYVNRKGKLGGVLLEELEPCDDGWVVSIGFDGTRTESSEPAVGSATALLYAGLGKKTITPVREVRHIYLDENGKFQKIN